MDQVNVTWDGPHILGRFLGIFLWISRGVTPFSGQDLGQTVVEVQRGWFCFLRVSFFFVYTQRLIRPSIARVLTPTTRDARHSIS